MSKLKYYDGHVAATPDANPPWWRKLASDGNFLVYQCIKPLVLRLQITETQLLTLVQNPHGHLQKKYGGETFVHQSVWSDNEYDVSFGNNPRDVIGLDALDDNIISEKFPDDDEKLFGANEFIDLNQDPETGMGLNFQARKA